MIRSASDYSNLDEFDLDEVFIAKSICKPPPLEKQKLNYFAQLRMQSKNVAIVPPLQQIKREPEEIKDDNSTLSDLLKANQDCDRYFSVPVAHHLQPTDFHLSVSTGGIAYTIPIHISQLQWHPNQGIHHSLLNLQPGTTNLVRFIIWK